MSNAVFPVLPGLKWNVVKKPRWSTITHLAASGKEVRAVLMSYPLWDFTLAYEVLRADMAYQELQTLMGFFNQRQGAFDTFLYADPTDNSVVNQQFGVGNGAATVFQITRSYGGFAEPVQNLNGSPSIYVGGALKSTPADYTIGATGIVTFTAAPANGAAIAWTGNFYYRCRFLDDEADFECFMYLLWELKKISFTSVKL